MSVIKPPGSLKHLAKSRKKVFLSGSIDNGSATDWQAVVAGKLDREDIIIFNPRRDGWNGEIEQSATTREFVEQVEWELNAMNIADIILMHFEPGTKSPITLLELGLYAGLNPEKLVVHCPEGFWKKGNVDVVCRFYGIKTVVDIDEMVGSV